MNDERRRQVDKIFHDFLEQEFHERGAFLDRVCAEPSLRKEVERLIRSHGEAGSLLDSPASDKANRPVGLRGSSPLAGRVFGRYELRSLLGSGGMGDVYRARDSELKRDVAIKVLPDAFSKDAKRVARFRREAEVLASLNHPNIAAIYDLETSGELRCLVLELVEGETLADRLKRGPVSIDEALRMAKQIADALEAAHEKGIIHRDLKPANIKLTDAGAVKVLDFGLAKAFEVDAAVSPNAETRMMTATGPGMILGTPAYMSPEQARGKVVDKRADIWAFGCVLYEMLTGRAPFARDTTTDTFAAILEREPVWSALPATTPAQVQRLLFRCLDKDLRGRLHDIADARIEIEDVLSGASPISASTAVVRPGQRPVRLLGSIAVIASLVALIAIGALMWNFRKAPRREAAPLRISRTSIASSGAAAVNPNVNLAITPDGRRIVYVGNEQIFVRPLDQVDPTVLYTAVTPLNRVFVSPNGQWVGFVEGNTLKKVNITGGPAITITYVDDGPGANGAAWAPNNTIIFATGNRATGLKSVPDDGGDVTVLTRPVPARGELDHLWPEMLPGGRAVLFTITATTGGPDAAQVAVLDLDTRVPRVVLPGGSHAHYVPSGHLVYTARGELRAIAFDLAKLETRGTPVTVLPGLVTSRLGRGFFDLAEGTLAYVDAPGGTIANTLVWVDRQGQEELLALSPGYYLHPRLSPDGKKVAVAGGEIFVWDLAGKTRTQLIPQGGQAPVWTADGLRLLFFGGWVAADGTGAAEPFGRGIPSGVTPDGKALFSPQGADIMAMALDGTRRVEPLIQTQFNERNGVVSPNGRWLAYESDSSGSFEIYVKPYPNVDAGRWTITTAGGKRPLWSRSGQELFYMANDGAIMAVPFDPRGVTGSALSTPTKVLAAGPYLTNSVPSSRNYDVSLDDKRFLVVKLPPATQATGPQIIVVQNWLFEELERLVPATR